MLIQLTGYYLKIRMCMNLNIFQLYIYFASFNESYWILLGDGKETYCSIGKNNINKIKAQDRKMDFEKNYS